MELSGFAAPDAHRFGEISERADRGFSLVSEEIFASVEAGLTKAAGLPLVRVALTSGCRIGELLALYWTDVSLLERELAVRRCYTPGIGEDTPKDGDERTVDLTPAALAALEEWCAFCGSPEAGLVFPNPAGGHLHPTTCTRTVLYCAMRAAGVPRKGEHGRKRNFHSLRHSFARVALENGARIEWVQRQLGHSSITLTIDTYGHWQRAAEKAEAEKLEGAFPVRVRMAART